LQKTDLLSYERSLLDAGYKYICGVDEVGRGPLAGPVTCCAVIMDLERIIEGVNDSKKLSGEMRAKLYPRLLDCAVAASTASLDNVTIDQINILNATRECMKKAVLGLPATPDIVLVDALQLDLPCKTFAIIHGDALSYSIAAASIIAKVERDTFMCGISAEFPEYGFERNKGYGTAEHIDALQKYGPTPYHRKSFIKNIAIYQGTTSTVLP
jgi:ribonuclease HII